MAGKPLPPRIRFLLKVALIGDALLVIVLGSAYAVLLAQTSAIASHVASRVLPRLSQEVGYDIRIGRLEASVLPLPYVDVSDLVARNPTWPFS